MKTLPVRVRVWVPYLFTRPDPCSFPVGPDTVWAWAVQAKRQRRRAIKNTTFNCLLNRLPQLQTPRLSIVDLKFDQDCWSLNASFFLPILVPLRVRNGSARTPNFLCKTRSEQNSMPSHMPNPQNWSSGVPEWRPISQSRLNPPSDRPSTKQTEHAMKTNLRLVARTTDQSGRSDGRRHIAAALSTASLSTPGLFIIIAYYTLPGRSTPDNIESCFSFSRNKRASGCLFL